MEERNKKAKKAALIAAIAAAALVIFFIVINIVAEMAEYLEIGYESVFYKNLETNVLTGAVTFVILLVIFVVNSIYIKRSSTEVFGKSPILKNKRRIFLISALLSLFLCIIISAKISPLYLSFYSSVPFNKADPVLGKDIGYYIFQRPFISALFDSIRITILFQIIFTVICFVLSSLLTDFTSFKSTIKENRIISHVIVLFALYFACVAVTYRFRDERLLFGKFGDLCGAGFTEVMVWHNYYRLAPFFIIAAVILTVVFILKKKPRAAAYTVLTVPALWILVFAASFIVQIAFVKPYEVSMQQPYINYNIEATKSAFGFNNIDEREFPADNDLGFSDIEANRQTIDNIRITDLGQTLSATNSLQSLRSFYSFSDSDIITYNINGKKTALMVSAREFDASKLPQSAQSYINKKLRYTHGYGIVASPVNTVTEEGQPLYLIKDIPIYSESGAPQVNQPRIYFGEKTEDYVVVNTKYSELDYMEGDKTIEFKYDGSAGITLNPWNRLIFSIKNADPMLLFSGYIRSDSKILTNRNIQDRAKKAAPFLSFDNDPYLVIDYDGCLKWVLDAYTTTDLYPYSQKYNGINYIRNSAKALIDAYNGNVELYITDNNDPIIRVYNRMYPGVFHEEGLPSYVTEQMHYPEYIFKIQSEVYKTYHILEPETLYSRSDIWVDAKEKYASGETVDVEPYYNLMRLSGDAEDSVIMQPYTPQGKENLVSWIAASSNPDNYGKITVYKFPKGKTVYGTLHIENKIDNDPNISKEISLWDQGGSSVIKGNLLVIPVKDSLLYVEPIYITAQNSAALPEVKRIVVAFGETVAMEPTLHEALEVVFGKRDATVKIPHDEKTTETLIAEAIGKYNEMENYSKSGEYKAFGASLDELGDILNELKEKTEAENTDTENAEEETAAGENDNSGFIFLDE